MTIQYCDSCWDRKRIMKVTRYVGNFELTVGQPGHQDTMLSTPSKSVANENQLLAARTMTYWFPKLEFVLAVRLRDPLRSIP